MLGQGLKCFLYSCVIIFSYLHLMLDELVALGYALSFFTALFDSDFVV